MKKILFSSLLVACIIFIFSCKKQVDGDTSSQSEKTTVVTVKLTATDTLDMLAGWWVENGGGAINFGKDNFVAFRASGYNNNNTGAGYWWLPKKDTIGFAESSDKKNASRYILKRLTKDSLITGLGIFHKLNSLQYTSAPISLFLTGKYNAGSFATYTKVLGSIAIDQANNIYFFNSETLNTSGNINKISATDGTITNVGGYLGNDRNGAKLGDNMPFNIAYIGYANALGVDLEGNIYASSSSQIRKINASDGKVNTICSYVDIRGMAVDKQGTVYFSGGDGAIYKVGTAGSFIKVAGIGGYQKNYSGDGGPAISAGMAPWAITTDSKGNIIFSDLSNYRIRKIDLTTGIISTIAGNGIVGTAGDGGLATASNLNQVGCVTVAINGDIYISDNGRLRKITATDGQINTIAGYVTVNSGFGPYIGATMHATATGLGIKGIVVSSSGNIYLTSSGYVASNDYSDAIYKM